MVEVAKLQQRYKAVEKINTTANIKSNLSHNYSHLKTQQQPNVSKEISALNITHPIDCVRCIRTIVENK